MPLTINASGSRQDLIDAVLVEVTRVWGREGLQGSAAEYAWLLDTYDISEEEDVQWQLVFEYAIDEMLDEDLDDEEVMTFVEDDAAVMDFLRRFLSKYRSSAVSFPVALVVQRWVDERPLPKDFRIPSRSAEQEDERWPLRKTS